MHKLERRMSQRTNGRTGSLVSTLSTFSILELTVVPFRPCITPVICGVECVDLVKVLLAD